MTHEKRMKGYKAEQAYKKKIEVHKGPFYGDLKPGKRRRTP